MKYVLTLLLSMLALPIFAEVAPVFTPGPDEEIAADEMNGGEAADESVSPAPVAPVAPPAAAAASANINRSASAASIRKAAAPSRQANAVSRAVGVRSAAPVAVDHGGAETRASGSRAASLGRTQTRSRTIANAVMGGPRATAQPPAAAGANRAVQARVGVSQAAAGGTLYKGAGARAAASGPVMAAARAPITIRSGTAMTIPSTFETNAAAAAPSIETAEEQAANVAFCKAQYMECMDGFCNVLDDNQGRCTCSSSIKKYESVEAALKTATENLQDIATKIRYLGLSKDDVNSLFKATEAELALNQTDSTTIKNNLDSIRKMLVDPTGQTTTSGGISSDFDLSGLSFGDSFDLSMFMGASSTSVLSQRGQALYDTAKARCASIVTDCKKRNVDGGIVTASYELEIDKQCVAYERALTDSNDKMKVTVKNATNVLQQARLMIAQNKNKYDLKGCVNALDTCMVDEFVCGQDYKLCLDPINKVIANGSVVVGEELKISELNVSETLPSSILNNKWPAPAIADKGKIYAMLLYKMGTLDGNGVSNGMCAGILKQCQNYTYNNDTFQATPDKNSVLYEYLTRAREKITAYQKNLIADYAQSCSQDVIACLSRNVGSGVVGATTGARTTADELNAINACKSYLTTCAAAMGMIANSKFGSDVSAAVCSASTKNLTIKVISSTPYTFECS